MFRARKVSWLKEIQLLKEKIYLTIHLYIVYNRENIVLKEENAYMKKLLNSSVSIFFYFLN